MHRKCGDIHMHESAAQGSHHTLIRLRAAMQWRIACAVVDQMAVQLSRKFATFIDMLLLWLRTVTTHARMSA